MNQSILRIGFNKSLSGSSSFSDSGRSSWGISASIGSSTNKNGHSSSRSGRVSVSKSLSKNGNHFRSWSSSKTLSLSRSKSKAHWGCNAMNQIYLRIGIDKGLKGSCYSGGRTSTRSLSVSRGRSTSDNRAKFSSSSNNRCGSVSLSNGKRYNHSLSNSKTFSKSKNSNIIP